MQRVTNRDYPILAGNGHSTGITLENKELNLRSFKGDRRKGYLSAYILDPFFYSCFAFSVIRNPFDLLPSIFFYNLNQSKTQHIKVKSFEHFIDLICSPKTWTSHEEHLNEPDENYALALDPIFKSFLFFQLFDTAGTCQCDAIFYLERIDRGLRKLFGDVSFLKDIINITGEKIQPSGGTLRDGKDYRDLYTSSMVDKVYKSFRREIDFFGYDFEKGLISEVDIIDPATFLYNIESDSLLFTKDRHKNFPLWWISVVADANRERNKGAPFDYGASTLKHCQVPPHTFIRKRDEIYGDKAKEVQVLFENAYVCMWNGISDSPMCSYVEDRRLNAIL